MDILIVDDSEKIRTSLRTWLESVFPRYLIEDAETGEEAIFRVLAGCPKFVLMDIGLPGINGIEATRRIKAVAPEVKVIILTIREGAQYEAFAAIAGASAYVSKRRMHRELIPILTNLPK